MSQQIDLSVLPPCPFCGSTELTSNDWSLDGGEVDAVECAGCYAGAPLAVWVMRAQPNGTDQEAV